MTERPELEVHQRGPIIICYDQEPLIPDFNKQLLDSITERWAPPYILLNTERDSDAKNTILKRYDHMYDVNYFYHGLCASDWYRGYRFDKRITDPSKRSIKKTFVTLNRITSGERVYRIIFVAKLLAEGLDKNSMISFSDVCADSGKHAVVELHHYGLKNKIDTSKLMSVLGTAKLPLRIDTPDDQPIPNRSHVMGPIEKFTEAAFFVVTETCFWGKKTHLTEKIFKPIVMKMPFILLGPAHNLKYLRSYGFRTFGDWIDESYDDIEDDLKRIDAVVEQLKKLEHINLEKMMYEMEEILNYNHSIFYSKEFVDDLWAEMTENFKTTLRLVKDTPLPEDRRLVYDNAIHDTISKIKQKKFWINV